MYYDDMVKEAYEEILGFGKEAGVKNVAGKVGRGISSASRAVAGAYTAKGYRQARRDYKDFLEANKDLGKKELKKLYKEEGGTAKRRMLTHALSTAGAYAVPIAAIAGTGLAVKRHRDKKRAIVEAEAAQAEKAAAYYDEAQYIKEAAEADYAEACAYEDAALEILDELGYLD